MGTRGPIPNRSEDLARPRERNGEARQQGEITKGELYATTVPRADPEWHPIARRLWDGCKTSGQSQYYQNSDWALLYSICDDLSEYKSSGKRSSMMATVIYSSLSTLLVSEGDRRRARLELQAPQVEQPDAALYAIDTYRSELEED